MMGTTHISFSLLLYFVLAYVFRPAFDWVLAVIVVAIGSLLPDIDHPRSFITQQGELFEIVSKGVTKVTTHRRMTHTLLSAIVLTIIVGIGSLVYHASIFIPAYFFIGYVSHLMADSLNPTGINWLYPFREFILKSGINTGSQVEKIFFYVISIIAGYLCYVLYLQ